DEIQTHRASIASIDVEVQALSHQIGRLNARKAHYLDLISKCRGKITLARRAPDEVLAHIFEHCVRGGWTKAPLVVSQVCAKWRQAASAPSVWAHVHLSSDNLDPVGKMRFWLSKAREAPLHISVDIAAVDLHFIHAFDLLLDRVAQWRAFSLTTRVTRFANVVLARCTHSAPRLTTLTVDTSLDPGIDETDEEWELSALQTAFPHSSDLHTVHIISNKFPPTIPTQVHDLTLELTNLDSAEDPSPLLNMLQSLSSLRSLTIITPFNYTDTFTVSEDQSHRSPATLAVLENLTLNSHRDFTELLHHIETPSLRTLNLRSVQDPQNFPHAPTGAAILSLLQRCSPPLVNLVLHDVDLPGSDFVSCFKLLPHLETLHLHETEVADEVFGTLKGPHGLCPKLKSLDLRWCEQLAGQTLVDLVSSRVSTGVDSPTGRRSCPIEKIRVINCAVVKESDVLELARTTVCIVVEDPWDYCRTKGCCHNARYRQRLHLRHIGDLEGQGGTPLHLIL
ncbi:hypothetical protein OF83DRAFT_1031410, partial [Amylostereum chailletii]